MAFHHRFLGLPKLLYDIPHALGGDIQPGRLGNHPGLTTVSRTANRLRRKLAHIRGNQTDLFDVQRFIQKMYAVLLLGGCIVYIHPPFVFHRTQLCFDAGFLEPLAPIPFPIPALHEYLVRLFQRFPYQTPPDFEYAVENF